MVHFSPYESPWGRSITRVVPLSASILEGLDGGRTTARLMVMTSVRLVQVGYSAVGIRGPGRKERFVCASYAHRMCQTRAREKGQSPIGLYWRSPVAYDVSPWLRYPRFTKMRFAMSHATGSSGFMVWSKQEMPHTIPEDQSNNTAIFAG